MLIDREESKKLVIFALINIQAYEEEDKILFNCCSMQHSMGWVYDIYTIPIV